jgi:hypothetical protein
MPTERAVLAAALDVLLVEPGGQTREVKWVATRKLNLASLRSDCVETDRALHVCLLGT